VKSETEGWRRGRRCDGSMLMIGEEDSPLGKDSKVVVALPILLLLLLLILILPLLLLLATLQPSIM
jgi:hypothetical protein